MSLSKKSKWVLIILIFVLIGAYSAYKYAYKPHTTIEELTVDFSGTSEDLMAKVVEDFTLWNNKVVELSGIITSKGEKGITLNNAIYCQFREDVSFSELELNQSIKLKGRLIGYDDLLNELKLNRCILK